MYARSLRVIGFVCSAIEDCKQRVPRGVGVPMGDYKQTSVYTGHLARIRLSQNLLDELRLTNAAKAKDATALTATTISRGSLDAAAASATAFEDWLLTANTLRTPMLDPPIQQIQREVESMSELVVPEEWPLTAAAFRKAMVSRADGSSFKGPDNGDAILGLDVVVTTLHKVPLDEEALFCKSYSPQGDFGAALFRAAYPEQHGEHKKPTNDVVWRDGQSSRRQETGAESVFVSLLQDEGVHHVPLNTDLWRVWD
ncbi:hypothetical protein CPB85DRAFT_1259500 [Mucidula mucida]|nr:hypothetical protein CPB85DRAFT_1259500 [Mucidula mucida]